MPVLLRNRTASGSVEEAMQPVRIFHSKAMRLWFQAMWYVTNQKHGVSALGLQRNSWRWRSYQTAWA